MIITDMLEKVRVILVGYNGIAKFQPNYNVLRTKFLTAHAAIAASILAVWATPRMSVR
jgi:hypothetical protein